MMKDALTIKRNLLELKALETFVRELQKKWRIAKKEAVEINLILDELVTNIVEHGNGSQIGSIEINFSVKDLVLTIELIDSGPAFDPTSCKTPDTTLPLEKRKCGGLGILLVRKLSDCVSYTRLKNKNIFTITKKLTEEPR